MTLTSCQAQSIWLPRIKWETEQIPLLYNGGVAGFLKDDVLLYAPDFWAWYDPSTVKVGYESHLAKGDTVMTEIIFEVTEDEIDGGYSASALGYGIHTEGDSLEEVRANIKEAVDCYFDETMQRPKLIRLHFVRDEVLTV